MRVLLLSQFHPEYVSGGAEWAAYSLFQNLRNHPSVEIAVLVSPVRPTEIGHAAPFGAFRGRPDEIVTSPPPIDPFTFESSDPDALAGLLSTLVETLKPDIAHAHHFLSWGIEAFDILARLGVGVVLTLHEFMLICNHFGQMITPQGRLCSRAFPVECSRCFPEVSAGKFFIRSEVIKSALAGVDRFIAPSEFLARRFVEWGLAAERISVIENCVNASLLAQVERPETRPNADPPKTIFGFFGNWNPFKGVDLLLEAYRSLPKESRVSTELRLFGTNEHWRGSAFEKRIRKLLASAEGVRTLGLYRNEDTLGLMADCDWIVVPSVWWENSPLVIQEAKLAGCRILCSDIGGMREKIDPAMDMTFTAGSAASLAEAMKQAIAAPRCAHLTRKRQIRLVGEEREKVDRHLRLYGAIFSEDAGERPMLGQERAAHPRRRRRLIA